MITVYGASDDLVEIEGAVEHEFSPADDKALLAFSDGTVLRIAYDADGFWRITRLFVGSAAYTKHEATHADDDYSDRVTLDILEYGWIVAGDTFLPIGEATR